MRKPIRLNSEEKQIEASVARYVPVKAEKRSKVEQAIEKAKKAKNINIRINEHDLMVLRDKAATEGIPYQTLIASVLHKYVSDRLLDEKEILRSIELLERRA